MCGKGVRNIDKSERSSGEVDRDMGSVMGGDGLFV